MRKAVMKALRTALVSFCGHLPRFILAPLSKILGTLFFKVDKKGRKRAIWQMELAKVGANDAERTAITQRVYQHIALTVLEVLWTVRHMEKALKDIRWEGLEILQKRRAEGKGVVLLSMHFGNWEVSGVPVGKEFPGTAIIAREQEDAGLNSLLASSRYASGLVLYPNRSDQTPVYLKHLAEGRLLGYLSDVYATRRHPEIPFLGVPSPTFLGAAAISRESGAPVVMVQFVREAPFKHVVKITDIPIEWTENKDADLMRVTTQFNEMISDRIREIPDQWLWIMKRFKFLPKDEVVPPKT